MITKLIGIAELFILRLFLAASFFCLNGKILIFYTTHHSKIIWNFTIFYFIPIVFILLLAAFLEKT